MYYLAHIFNKTHGNMKTKQKNKMPWSVRTKGAFDKHGFYIPVEFEDGSIQRVTIDVDFSTYYDAISATVQDHHIRADAVARLKSLEQRLPELIVTAVNKELGYE